MAVEIDLTGKVAMITGASRGIGRAIALRSAQAGADLFITSTENSRDLSEAIAAEAEKNGVKVIYFPINLVSSGVAEVLRDEAIKAFGHVDILGNIAGNNRDNLIPRLKEEDHEDIMDINYRAARRLISAIVPVMSKQKWGRIISLSSVSFDVGTPGQSNYTASKGALEGFTKSAAAEYATRNITINCIAAGFADTDLTARLTPEQREAIIKASAMKRRVELEEIANEFIYLASPLASAVTGQIRRVDCGLVRR